MCGSLAIPYRLCRAKRKNYFVYTVGVVVVGVVENVENSEMPLFILDFTLFLSTFYQGFRGVKEKSIKSTAYQ